MLLSTLQDVTVEWLCVRGGVAALGALTAGTVDFAYCNEAPVVKRAARVGDVVVLASIGGYIVKGSFVWIRAH